MTSPLKMSSATLNLTLNNNNFNPDVCLPEYQVWRTRQTRDFQDAKAKIHHRWTELFDVFSLGCIIHPKILHSTGVLQRKQIDEVLEKFSSKICHKSGKFYKWLDRKDLLDGTVKKAIVLALSMKYQKFPLCEKGNLELLAQGLHFTSSQTDENSRFEEIPTNLYLFGRFLRAVWLRRQEMESMFRKKLANISLLEDVTVQIFQLQKNFSHRKLQKQTAEIVGLYWFNKQTIDKFLDSLHPVFLEECNQNIFMSVTFSEEKQNHLFDTKSRLSLLVDLTDNRKRKSLENLESPSKVMEPQVPKSIRSSDKTTDDETSNNRKRKSLENLESPTKVKKVPKLIPNSDKTTADETPNPTENPDSISASPAEKETEKSVDNYDWMSDHKYFIIMPIIDESCYLSLPSDENHKEIITNGANIHYCCENINKIFQMAAETEIQLLKQNKLFVYTCNQNTFKLLVETYEKLKVTCIQLPVSILDIKKVFIKDKVEMSLRYESWETVLTFEADKNLRYLKIGSALFQTKDYSGIIERIYDLLDKSPAVLLNNVANSDSKEKLLEKKNELGKSFIRRVKICELVSLDDESYTPPTSVGIENVPLVANIKEEKPDENNKLQSSPVITSTMPNSSPSSLLMKIKVEKGPVENSVKSQLIARLSPEKNEKAREERNSTENHSSSSSDTVDDSYSPSDSDFEALSSKTKKRIAKEATEIQNKADIVSYDTAKNLAYEEFLEEDHLAISNTTQKNMLRYVIRSGNYGKAKHVKKFWQKFGELVPEEKRLDPGRYKANWKLSVCKGKVKTLLNQIHFPPSTKHLILEYTIQHEKRKGKFYVFREPKKVLKDLKEKLDKR